MKKRILICTLLCSIFCLCGCYIEEEKPQPNEQQSQCEHEYVEIAWHYDFITGVTEDIYCPKCQWETTVSYEEWERIQVDMDYRNNK